MDVNSPVISAHTALTEKGNKEGEVNIVTDENHQKCS